MSKLSHIEWAGAVSTDPRAKLSDAVAIVRQALKQDETRQRLALSSFQQPGVSSLTLTSSMRDKGVEEELGGAAYPAKIFPDNKMAILPPNCIDSKGDE